MSQALVTYSGDRRLVLSNGEAIRAPIYLANWTKIRIGVLGAFVNASGSISGTPRFAVGVCNGNTNGYGAAASDHVVGIHTIDSSLTYNASPAYVSCTTTKVLKRVGATLSEAASGGGGFKISADTAIRSGFFVEITKGSPNFTIQSGFEQATSVGTNMTDTQFLQIMELADISQIATVKANMSAGSAISLAVDEATNGDLDHLFVFWDRTAVQYGFNIAHKKLA